jgi:very-short-patch-repair endonuclease
MPNMELMLAKEKREASPCPSERGAREGKRQYGYVTADPAKYKFIKEMRTALKDNPTRAEALIWQHLRNKKTGFKIRRQHIIDGFISDFVCLSKKVVIEIDGKIHLQQKEYDELRTNRLSELGYEVIRFTSEEVFSTPELVAKRIKEHLETISDSTEPPPLEGQGEAPPA